MARKILIVGAGEFGVALAINFCQVPENEVTLWARNKQTISKIVNDQTFNFVISAPQPILVPHNLILISDERISLSGYDFVVLAVPFLALTEITSIEWNKECEPNIVVVQKAMRDFISPADVIGELCPSAKVLQCTGAALSRDLAMGTTVGLIISYTAPYHGLAVRLAKAFPCNCKIALCDDVYGIAVWNTLRTVGSYQMGLGYGYYEGTPCLESTIALFYSWVIDEMKLIAQKFEFAPEYFNPTSKVGKVLIADVLLCQRYTHEKPNSRNFALGLWMGRGLTLKEALAQVASTTESVDNCISVGHMVKKQLLLRRNAEQSLRLSFPLLAATLDFLNGAPLDVVSKNLLNPIKTSQSL